MRDATLRFGALRALDGVNLSLRRGEVLALLGDNGAGKSTLVKSINGVNSLDRGDVVLDGRPLTNGGPQAARAAGIETVHQDLALFDNLSATENMFAGRELVGPRWLGRLGLVRKRDMTERTRATLRELQVGITDPAALIGLMSGGQRQAIAVARAHAFASKVVLLDEPTAALGVRESEAVLRVIKGLPARGVSVILVSHNLDHVARIADRAVVLRRGRIIGEAIPTPENHERIVSMIVGSSFAPGGIAA
ncbi:MAG TPA: ATP-binding cassette domain-containing protein [Conexibacter sp.]|nr:ATP-binding cassette domain-containing protein [Conexibacter sp.]